MRTLLFLNTLLLFSCITKAQILNADFENWNTITFDNIDTWTTQGKVTKVASAQQCSFAAKIETNNQGLLLTPGAMALTSTFPDGYPYTSKIDTVKIWVKYNIANMDTATIHIEQFNNVNLVRAGNRFVTAGNVGNWTELSIPMEALDTISNPLSILITINNTLDYNPQITSFIVVDNIRCYYKGILQTSLPNNSFETWTSQSIKEITDWTTSNELLSQFGIDSINCEQTSSAQKGNYGVKIHTIDIFGTFIPGGMVTGAHRLDAAQDPATFPTIAVNERYSSLSGYLKFTKQATDFGEAAVYMFKNGLLIGQGHYYQKGSLNTYTQFEAKIDYDLSFSGIPDSATIIFLSASDPNNASGACVLWVDNIQLNKFSLGIKNNQEKHLVYPNPFNNELHFNCNAEDAMAIITASDGKEVFSQTMSKGRNDINTIALANGVYILKIIDGNELSTIKIVKR